MKVKKILMILLLGIWIFSLSYRTYLFSEYGHTLSQVPLPNVGRIIPLNNHGTIVYLTKQEDSQLNWILIGGMACGICAGLLFKNKP